MKSSPPSVDFVSWFVQAVFRCKEEKRCVKVIFTQLHILRDHLDTQAAKTHISTSILAEEIMSHGPDVGRKIRKRAGVF